MKKKKFITAVLLSFTLLTSGCSIGGLNSVINELHGSLVGNSYTIDTYDNYGNKTLETTGKKISITGNKIETVSYDDTGKAIKGYDLSSVITITIDGKEIESCGDTCNFHAGRPEPGGGFHRGSHPEQQRWPYRQRGSCPLHKQVQELLQASPGSW